MHREHLYSGLISILLCVCSGNTDIHAGNADDGHGDKKGTVYMVSNAHFDTQWLWDVHSSIDVFLKRTLDQNLYLLDNYPDYIFNFEGGVKYEWMKEYWPLQYARVKNYISNGRWHISGASYDATDTNIPSPESFFRNILLGQNLYMREFGRKSTDIFLPDCFGFGYTLPTIAAHCGLTGFSTQKLTWRQVPFYEGDAKIPFRFGVWEGIDGSSILAYLDGRGYGKRYEDGDVSSDKELIDIAENGVNHNGMRYHGTGDQGGSASIGTVRSLTEASRRGKGPVDVKFAASDDLFRKYSSQASRSELPIFRGELLMDLHGTGCYTSQAAMKCYNRANERLADAAERACVMAEWLGGSRYPANRMNEAWKRFIWHQFHDDLTGTSIPAAYQVSWNDEIIAQTQFAELLTTASREIASGMDTRVSGTPVVVFNSMAFARKETVHAVVPMEMKPSGVSVVSPDGKKVKAQLLSWEDGKAEIIFNADVPPLSYNVFGVRPVRSSGTGSLSWGEDWIENGVYRIRLNADGDIMSITDKRNGRELVGKGKAMRLAVINGNKSAVWPAWEILKETIDTPSVPVCDDVRISIDEKGPARVTVKIEKRYNESLFVQRISLTDGAADDRIDVETNIDWCQKDALLKAEFPLSVSSAEATYDLGLGTIRRGNNTPQAYEVPAYQWADITADDSSYGVTVVSDYKTGWDKPEDNMLRLTLLHTPSTPARHPHSRTQDFGHHVIRYSIIGHEGDCATAGIQRKADAANNRLYSFNATRHDGPVGKSVSILTVDSDGIDLKAFKKTDRENMYVLRFYESSGQGVENAEVRFATDIQDADTANGIEEITGDAHFDGNKLFVSTTGFSPKTFLVRLDRPEMKLRPTSCRKVVLPYNTQAYTVDEFTWIADADGRGHSYSYDLLPGEMISSGIPFSFGKLAEPNAVKCDGGKIELPEHDGCNTLYILAASMNGDRTASFIADGKMYDYSIPYYSGYFGQWGWITETGAGYVKDAPVAYIGTHRHDTWAGNESYTYTYMYRIAVPVSPDTKEIVLPDDPDIMIFAATLSDVDPSSFGAADEFRALP